MGHLPLPSSFQLFNFHSVFMSLVSRRIFSLFVSFTPLSSVFISLSLCLTHAHRHLHYYLNPYGNTLICFLKALVSRFISSVYILPPFTSTLGDAQMSEWQKVQMKGKVRSSSASSSWHCITSHSNADVIWFPSVLSEAPQQQGGAFFHPFPSTFAWH